MKGFTYRRVKNDQRDAADLADLLRMNRLPEAYVAPPAVRELRELVRHRAKLVAVRSGIKAGVHAVLAKQSVLIPVTGGGVDELQQGSAILLTLDSQGDGTDACGSAPIDLPL
ncbi:IS110 family transposase [Actinoplanes subtropicus]|uniref:IS110 family transposase n=1 Tax=Actinoplanes subtropicus TaxID=543632 RepID=UPI0004C46FD7|nr:IS110 family transposase [Actinoplanes subtropicus]